MFKCKIMLTGGGRVNPLLVFVNWCWFTEFPYMLSFPEKVDNGKSVIVFLQIINFEVKMYVASSVNKKSYSVPQRCKYI